LAKFCKNKFKQLPIQQNLHGFLIFSHKGKVFDVDFMKQNVCLRKVVSVLIFLYCHAGYNSTRCGTGSMYLQELYFPFGTEVHKDNWRGGRGLGGWGRMGGLEK
jgi:hypothetical protein